MNPRGSLPARHRLINNVPICLDLDPGPPREARQPCVRLNPEHWAAGRLKLPGCDAGASADVEEVCSGAGGDDPLHQRAGIGGRVRS